MIDDTTGDFNHVILIDMVNLSDGNVFHVIFVDTGFQLGTFENRMRAEYAWKILRRCWINIYAGAPEAIETDAVCNLATAEINAFAESFDIVLKVAPTEGNNCIGKVERIHVILPSVFS